MLDELATSGRIRWVQRRWLKFMPELQPCFYCKKAIDPKEDNYVSVAADTQDSPGFGEVIYQRYAHAKCHDQMAEIENG
jgi:hypothetical protein